MYNNHNNTLRDFLQNKISEFYNTSKSKLFAFDVNKMNSNSILKKVKKIIRNFKTAQIFTS